jgi:hypothetical protein
MTRRLKLGRIGIALAALYAGMGALAPEAMAQSERGDGASGRDAEKGGERGGLPFRTRSEERRSFDQACAYDIAKSFGPARLGGVSQAHAPTAESWRDKMVQCHNQLVQSTSNMDQRRSYYRAASGLGAFGAAIGGSAAAASTTNGLSMLGLVPVLLEDVIHNDESGTLNLVAARALRWSVNRSIYYDAQFERMGKASISLRASAISLTSTCALLDSFRTDAENDKEKASSSNDALRAELLAAIAPDVANPEKAKSVSGSADAIVARIMRRLEVVETEASPGDRIAGIDDLKADCGALVVAAETTVRDLDSEKGFGERRLMGWTSGRYFQVLDIYRSQRMSAAKSPEDTFRSVLAFPFTTVSRIVRGGANDALQNARLATAVSITPQLRGIAEPIGARDHANQFAGVTPMMEKFRGDPKLIALARRIEVEANALVQQGKFGVSLMEEVARMDGEPAPDFALPGAGEAGATEAVAADTASAPPQEPPPQAGPIVAAGSTQ